VAAADVLAAATATFGTSSLELAVARNRFATATVKGKKNDAALQKALLVLGEGNVATAQQDADAAERALAVQLQAAGVDARLTAAAFAPVLAAVRSGHELPSSAVAVTRDARLDAADLTKRLAALPPLSADLRVGDVWTRSGVSRRQAVRRKLTLSEMQRIIPNLLVPLGTRTTKRLIADLEALSSSCSQRTRTQALQSFRRAARGLTSTRMLDTAVDPIVINRRRRCG
jgi:hypothetical protein